MNNVTTNERPATDKQIRTFVANAAADVMINQMLGGTGRSTRKAHRATGAKVYFQVKEALITAIRNEPALRPNQATMQTLIANLDNPTGIGFDMLFIAGFQAMRASHDEIGQLLLKDGLTPAKAKKAAATFQKLAQQTERLTPDVDFSAVPVSKPSAKKANVSIRKQSKKAVKATVSVLEQPKAVKAQTVGDIDREIERLMMLRDEAEMAI
jgi:outer membrane murein-binding lipoprotein Lpp